MVTMRFEMNSDAVLALAFIFERALLSINDEMNKSLAKVILINCKTILKKIKVYGSEAWGTREEFRNDMKSYTESIEKLEKVFYDG